MKQGRVIGSYILPQALVFHEVHPASELDFRIKNRLMDVSYSKQEDRKISRKALMQLLEVNPIHITGPSSKPRVISGWAKMYAAKLFNIDAELPCVDWKSISDKEISEMAYLDFFIDSALVRHDDVARRIRSICLEVRKSDKVIGELFGQQLDTRNYYDLPAVRTKRALEGKLKDEDITVQRFIIDHFENNLFNK